MRQKGGISVFLTLLLTVISGFIMTLVTYAKGYAPGCEAVCAIDRAIRSCFAEYNKKVFERYHILMIDSSYKGIENGSERTLEHFSVYLNNSVSKSSICNTQITDVRRVLENDCEYMYRQAVMYEKNKTDTTSDLTAKDDDAYFRDYLREVFGHYNDPREGSVREGELEYLLFGPGLDPDNIDRALSEYEENEVCEGYERLSYEEHLYGRLEAEDPSVLRQRFSELVEESIRETGSPGFDLTECYHSLSFTAEIEGPAGEYSITRAYGYGSDEI